MLPFHRHGKSTLSQESLDFVFWQSVSISKLVDRNIQIKKVRTPLWIIVSFHFLIEKGYDPAFGARPLRRAVEKYLQDPLAEEILRGTIKPSETVEVVVADDKLVFNQKLAASAG